MARGTRQKGERAPKNGFFFFVISQATCVPPTLKKNVDLGYGWYSLREALKDHRDLVRGLIQGAKSYTISLPKETGTTILTHNGETHLKGNIFLGESETVNT